MTYTRVEFIDRVRRGDFHGLKLAGLVRLSFEPKYLKDKGRPMVLLSGADVNGREDQEERCRRYVEERGGEYVYSYDEPNTSAWRRKRMIKPDGTIEWRVKRPVFEGALEDLKRGVAPNGQAIDGLIHYDLDRMTRDHRHLEDAIDVADHYTKAFLDITGTLDLLTQNGQDNARFLVTVKARQSADTSRRVSDKHEAIAKAGIPVGGSRPFGWNEDKRTLHPVESELLRKARLDVLAGIGLHTICREWNDAGIRTPRGNLWRRPVLRTLLLSPRLAGYRVYQEEVCLNPNGKPVMGQYEPIFTVHEWEDLKAYLTREGRYAQDVHMGGRKHLLSGVARCGLCGATCRSYADNRIGAFYYACPAPTSEGTCGKVSINGVKLDHLVEERVLSHLAGLEVQTEVIPWAHGDTLASKEVKIKELMDAYQVGELAKEDVFPVVARLRKDVAALTRDRAAWSQCHLA